MDYDTEATSYVLVVHVTDAGSTNTATATVNVNIVAVNEDTPTFSSTTVSIAEDSSPGTTVATFAAVDNDASPHGITSYAILSGNCTFVTEF